MSGFGRVYRATLLGTVPAAYAALSCADPGDNAAEFVEAHTLGADGYSRLAVAWAAPNIPIDGAPGMLVSSADLTWTSGVAWPATVLRAISHVAVWSSPTSTSEANYIGSMPLSPSFVIERAGQTVLIPAGSLYFSLGLKE